MFRKLFFCAGFLALSAVTTSVFGQNVPFGLYPDAEFSPDFTLLESTESVIRFELNWTRLQPTGLINLNQRLSGTWGQMNVNGSLIPRFTFYLSLPATGNPTVAIEDTTTIWRPTLHWSQGENHPTDPRFTLGEVGILGGVRVVPLTVKPVIYTNNADSCRIINHAEIRIDIDSQQGQNPLTSVRQAYSEAWRSIFQAVVMNWQSIPNLMVREPSHVLMFVPDAYLGSVAQFIEWKKQMGMQVTVVSASEINGDGNGNLLRNRIISELNASGTRVDNVILVGDETVIPVHYLWTDDPVSRFSSESYDGQFTNEGYFTELEGDDVFPDVFLGRWPVNTPAEASTIANRTVNHERNAFASDTARFEHCVVSADNSVPSQRQSIAYSRQMLLREGFEVVDTVWAQDNPGPQLMISLVDEGCTFVNHRGSGWNQGWAGINFYYWNVPEISNAGKLPVVTGIGCGVAKFDAGDSQCFGEEWMTHGTSTNPMGSVGFVGPCWNTHTVYNDNLDTCLYKAILTYNIDNLMPALVAGKMFAWALFSDFMGESAVEEVSHVMMRQYLVLSDPSLKLYTNTPARIPMTMSSAIPAGPFTLPIVIAEGFSTEADSFEVTFWTAEGAQQTQVLPAEPGIYNVNVDFAFGSEVVATLTGHNVLARQFPITVSPSGTFLIHQGQSYSDIGGNSDGHVQIGEPIQLTDSVRNIGSDAGFVVTGAVATTQEFVNFATSVSTYGTVGSNETIPANPPYAFTIDPDFRGSSLAIDVTYAANGVEPRTDQFFVTVYAPELDQSGLIVSDGEDGVLERREEAGLVFTLTNTGNETLPASVLALSSESEYIILVDGSADIPSLAPDQSYTLPSDAVRISAAWNAPSGTQVEVQANVTTQMPAYEFHRSITLPLVLGLIGPSDPMAGSDGVYYMYDDLDVDYDRAAVYDWYEISPALGGPGIELEFTQSQQTFAVAVPFNNWYFGQNFTDLSISTDGWVAPGVTDHVSFDNHALPYAPDLVSGMIAVLWNDLWYFFGDTGDISYYYDAVGDRFIVEWHEITDWGTGTRPNTFQIQLLNPASHPTPTGDSEWLMLYQDLTMHQTAALGATIGYETVDEQEGATFYHNQVGPPTSASLTNGRAIRLTTAPPTLLSAAEKPALPTNFTLFQNYPNPFNPETTIEFSVPTRTDLRLEIFDVLGRNVATLADGIRDAGHYRLQWNGTSRAGVSVPSGIYFYRLATPEFVQTKRMLLMR